MRVAELDATQIAQAKADAAKVRLSAEASADAEAIRIRRVADATAESIEKVNRAMRRAAKRTSSTARSRCCRMLVPQIAEALAQSKMVTISGGENGGAANQTTSNIAQVIQTVLAAQLVAKQGIIDAAEAKLPIASTPAAPPRSRVKAWKSEERRWSVRSPLCSLDPV